MNLKPIRDAVRAKISALYKERFPVKGQPPVDIPGFDETVARWRRFIANTNNFEAHLEKTRYREARRIKLKERARDIMEDIAAFNFCAIDIIPTPDDTQIMSIGITTMVDAVMESMHIDIAGTSDEPHDFEHGDRITMQLDSALEILEARLYDCDFVVGQTLVNDFAYLRDLAGITFEKRSMLDTAQFHAFLKGGYGRSNTPPLVDIMPLYGLIPMPKGVAGNQALAAMQTMLVMLSEAAA